MADVLLTLGFDTSQLAASYAQVQNAIAGLSTQMPSIIKPGSTQLVDQYGKAIKSATETTEAAGAAAVHASRGFAQLLSRISIWAFAWSAMYALVRKITKEIVVLYETWADLNKVVNQSRIMAEETSAIYETKYLKIQRSIIEASLAGTQSISGLANAYGILRREGLNEELSANALRFVDTIATVQALKPEQTATILAEAYSTYKDVLKGTVSETEKLRYITELLMSVYIKGNVKATEFYTLLSKIALVSKSSGVDVEWLAKMVIFLDENMVGGRQASMILAKALEDTYFSIDNVNKVLNTEINEFADFQTVLKAIESSLRGYSEEAKKAILLQIFGKENIKAVSAFLELMKTGDVTLSQYNITTFATSEALKKATEQANMFRESQAKLRATNVGLIQSLKELFAPGLAKGQIAVQEEVAANFEKIMKDLQDQYDAGKKTFQDYVREREYYLKVLENYVKRIAEEEGKIAKTRAKAIPKAAEVPVETYAKLLPSQAEYVNQLKEGLYISSLENIGVNERIIAQERLNSKIRILTDDELKRTALSKISAVDLNDAYLQAWKILQDQGKAKEYILALTEQEGALAKANYEEIRALADELQSSATDYIKSLMSGTGDFKEYLASMVDAYRTAFAEKIVTLFGKDTGLFTGMATAFMSPLQKGIYDGSVVGSKMYYDAIVSASSGAAYTGIGGAAGAAKGKTPFMDMLSSVGGIFGTSKTETSKLSEAYKSQELGTDTLGDIGSGIADMKDAGEKTATATSTMSKAMSAAGKVAGVAGGLYSGYQGVMAARQQGGVQGALGGAMSGAMAGAAFGPWGMAIGGVIGGIMGGLGGGKKQHPDVPPVFSRVESNIKISNAHLEAISRNTHALNRGFEKYLSIAPTSAYFAEAGGIESRFLRSRMMIAD